MPKCRPRPEVVENQQTAGVSIMLPTIGVVYVRTYKCAASSTGAVLSGWGKRRWKMRHARAACFEYVGLRDLAFLASQHRDWIFLALCRHPLTRLVSAWHHPGFAERGDDHYTFERFVHDVAATPDGSCDQHIRSQTYLRPDAVVNLPLEDMPASWQVVQDAIAARGMEPPPELTHLNPSQRRADWTTYYTPELRAIAEQRYADDFARLPYAQGIDTVTT